MFSATFNRQKLQSAVIKEIFSENYNFEQGTIPANSQVNGSAQFDVGTVLGQVLFGTPTVAAKAGGNTGNGTFTIDPATPLLANAMAGTYQARCIAAAANNGTFRFTDPRGRVLADVVMSGGSGVFADLIKGTLADGTTDFVVGDGFDITVPAGSGKYVPHDEAALDGSQFAAAVVGRNTKVSASVDTPVVLLKRGPAVVVADSLVWKTGISAAGLAAGLAALAAAGIVSRNF